MQVRVSKWGDSLAIRLPKELADGLGLEEGQCLDLLIEGDTVKLRPDVAVPHYRLEDLVAEAERFRNCRLGSGRRRRGYRG
jgi:antitoxin MazE